MRFLLIFLSAFVLSIFAQEKRENAGKIDITIFEIGMHPPFLFRNDFSETHFYEQTRKIVAMAPDNKVLLESERRWHVFSHVLAGLFYEDMINRSAFLHSFPTINKSKLQQSVDNYNYYRIYNRQSAD